MGDDCNFTDFPANGTFSAWNDSFENCTFDFDNKIPTVGGPDKDTEIALKLVFYFLAAIADSLLLFVMFKDPLHRFSNTTSYFIINFAVADLMSIVAGIFQSIFQSLSVQYIKDRQQRREEMKRQELTSCFAAIGEQCSFLIIMIFAIDRYLAIGHPYKYKQIVEKKYVLLTLLLLPWCFSVTILPVIYFASAYSDGRTLTNLFAGDIIALTVITLIVHPLTHWQFKRKSEQLARSTYNDKTILEENLKIAKVLASTVLLVSGCLIVFVSPYFVAFCFSLAGCDRCFLNDKFLSLWRYYPLLRSVRLLTNSIVYAWRLPLYRRSLRTLFANVKWLRRNGSLLAINRIEHAPERAKVGQREVVEMKPNLGLQCDGPSQNGTVVPPMSQERHINPAISI